jgi:hypothetical protein
LQFGRDFFVESATRPEHRVKPDVKLERSQLLRDDRYRLAFSALIADENVGHTQNLKTMLGP